MSVFRSIVFTSVLTGLIVGVAVSAVQHFGTTPLILQAETYENAAPAHNHEAATPEAGQDAAAAAPATTEAAPAEEEAWGPADGVERFLYTAAANILTAIGYALVLTGLFSLRSKTIGWREGLLWGLGGFAAVMLAPMLGLPPELPGTPAAPLFDRQVWWIGTVAATAAGLALIAFQRKPWAAVLGIVLIVAPHVIGAPAMPEGETALAPAVLEHRFIVAAVVSSFIFWALLGSISGSLYRRFEASA